jgi:hypothetical protein
LLPGISAAPQRAITTYASEMQDVKTEANRAVDNDVALETHGRVSNARDKAGLIVNQKVRIYKSLPGKAK